MAAPYGSTQPHPPVRRRRGGIVGPLVLIFIGGVFLLQNAGILPPTVWGNLWRLWPLVLVLAGLELLVAQRVPWLFALLGLALVIVALGAATSAYVIPGLPGVGRAEPVATRTVRTDLGGARQASVTVRFGAGSLTVGPQVSAAPGALAAMTFVGQADLVPIPKYTLVGDTGQLEYQIDSRGGPGSWPFVGNSSATPSLEIDLARDVPITALTVETGAADARLDLSSLKVASLDVAVGAATAWMRLPESGVTTAHIRGGAATITLEIPQGVAAQIHHRGGLSAFNIDQTRFPAVGDELNRSPNYDSSTSKVDVTIETGVTTIQVN